MPHTSGLEDLIEYCPVCGEKHKADLKHQMHQKTLYSSGTCVECGYEVIIEEEFTQAHKKKHRDNSHFSFIKSISKDGHAV